MLTDVAKRLLKSSVILNRRPRRINYGVDLCNFYSPKGFQATRDGGCQCESSAIYKSNSNTKKVGNNDGDYRKHSFTSDLKKNSNNNNKYPCIIFRLSQTQYNYRYRING